MPRALIVDRHLRTLSGHLLWPTVGSAGAGAPAGQSPLAAECQKRAIFKMHQTEGFVEFQGALRSSETGNLCFRRLGIVSPMILVPYRSSSRSMRSTCTVCAPSWAWNLPLASRSLTCLGKSMAPQGSAHTACFPLRFQMSTTESG